MFSTIIVLSISACSDRYGRGFCKNFKVDCKDTNEIKGVQIRVLCSRSCGLCDGKCIFNFIHLLLLRISKFLEEANE